MKAEIMKLLSGLTNTIHSTHTSNLAIRANYLYDLYRSESEEHLEGHDYLDIGCGYGVNSEVFGKGFKNIYCSDLGTDNLVKCGEYMGWSENVFHIAADAQRLPFDDEHFDLVTAISLIEHVPDQEKMLREALRVLKTGGELVMQFPNMHFFMELHSGIPFYCLVPGFARPWVSKKLGYSGLSEINIPASGKVKRMMEDIDSSVNIKIVKVVYPVEVVPPRFRVFYSILKKIGVFRIVPFGWMVICKK
jgi:ubiquinone/menaquinone biosynthesis C-methylase UbiE